MTQDFHRRLTAAEKAHAGRSGAHGRRPKQERDALVADALAQPGGLATALAAIGDPTAASDSQRAAIEAAWRADT